MQACQADIAEYFPRFLEELRKINADDSTFLSMIPNITVQMYNTLLFRFFQQKLYADCTEKNSIHNALLEVLWKKEKDF